MNKVWRKWKDIKKKHGEKYSKRKGKKLDRKREREKGGKRETKRDRIECKVKKKSFISLRFARKFEKRERCVF